MPCALHQRERGRRYHSKRYTQELEEINWVMQEPGPVGTHSIPRRQVVHIDLESGNKVEVRYGRQQDQRDRYSSNQAARPGQFVFQAHLPLIPMRNEQSPCASETSQAERRHYYYYINDGPGEEKP